MELPLTFIDFAVTELHGFIQCVVCALGAGLGFRPALVLLAGLREKLELAAVPDVV